MTKFNEIKAKVEAFNQACYTRDALRTDKQWTLLENEDFSFETELLLKALELVIDSANRNTFISNCPFDTDPDYWIEQAEKELSK